MLFPTEDEYMQWFTKAGFKDVKITRIGPKWYRGVRRHGLIMGCSVTGVKPQVGWCGLTLEFVFKGHLSAVWVPDMSEVADGNGYLGNKACMSCAYVVESLVSW